MSAKQSNCDFLLRFLKGTRDIEDDLAETIISVMCQHLGLSVFSVKELHDKKGYVTRTENFELQIKSLRKCIVDLEECLNFTLSRKDKLQ